VQRAGETLITARKNKHDPVASLIELLARRLFDGKVIDVERVTAGGWNRGTATLAGFHGAAIAGAGAVPERVPDGRGERGAGRDHPDLIAMLDVETGEPVTADCCARSARHADRLSMRSAMAHPAGIALAGRAASAMTSRTRRSSQRDYSRRSLMAAHLEPRVTITRPAGPCGRAAPMFEVLVIRSARSRAYRNCCSAHRWASAHVPRGRVGDDPRLGDPAGVELGARAAACAEGLSTTLLACWAGFGGSAPHSSAR